MHTEIELRPRARTNQLRKRLLVTMRQPMTVAQLARAVEAPLKRCSEAICAMREDRLLRCLNPTATSGRVYWMTQSGKTIQRSLLEHTRMETPKHHVPIVDWPLYGRVACAHRAIVIRTLGEAGDEPLQPARIKRIAYFRDPTIKMSANNTRDAVRFLHEQGVVERVWLRRRGHPRYRLTELGKQYQVLLARARIRTWPK